MPRYSSTGDRDTIESCGVDGQFAIYKCVDNNFNKKLAVETYEKLLNLIIKAPDRKYFEKEMLKNYYNQVALAVDYAKKVFGPEFPPY